jgi:NitT/TauT family transport system ATP-binding protein
MIEFKAVEKRYGESAQILAGITLTIHSGEFVTFVGPSGCGKSTLLRLIAGLNPVTGGNLTVQGQPPEKSAASLGFVFQEPTLLPWLTVAANVEVPLALRRVPAGQRRERGAQALSLVRLAEKRNAFPRQLSGGQKMRVSLARALATAPALLLLDEPFGALDEMTRDTLNEELLAIRQEAQWTACFVTHSVAEAVFLSNRVVVLAANPGRIHSEHTIPFPYPRTAATRQSDEFHRSVVTISRALRSTTP